MVRMGRDDQIRQAAGRLATDMGDEADLRLLLADETTAEAWAPEIRRGLRRLNPTDTHIWEAALSCGFGSEVASASSAPLRLVVEVAAGRGRAAAEARERLGRLGRSDTGWRVICDQIEAGERDAAKLMELAAIICETAT